MNTEVLNVDSSTYRIMIPMTYSKEEVESKINKYNKTGLFDNPITNGVVVNISSVIIDTYYGLNIYIINWP